MSVELAGPTIPSVPNRREVLVVFIGLMLVLLMAALDQTIVSTALPTIVGDLGGLTHISWVVTAYLLAQTAVTPIYGKLGDLYGRKIVLQVALVVFLIGSALCGASQNLTELIVFRAIQGLGGGGLIVGTMAAIGDVVPPRERGRYQGMFGAVFGLASVIGPLLGGFLTTSLTWRWIFYVNLPIGLLAFTVLAATLPSRSDETHHRIDYLGAALLAAALSALVLCCTLGGTTYSWGSPLVIGLGVAALVLLVLFARAERRAAEPILPPHLFANPVFSVTSAIGLVVGFALFGSVTYLPLFLQVVNGASPTGSGLQILPLMVGLLITSIGSGQIISRTGRYKPFPIAGTGIMVIGLALLSTMDAHTSRVAASGFMFVLGLGLGLVMQVLVLAVQNAVEYKDLGVATSGATLFRSIGGSVGTAVLGSIFSNRLSSELASSLPASAKAALGSGISQANPAALHRLPATIHAAYIAAFTNALGTVFVVAAVVAGVAFLLSWALPQRQLRDSVVAGSGIGESFAIPKHTDSLAEASRALSTLIGRERRKLFVEQLAARAGVDLSAGAAWLIVRLQEDPAADIADLTERFAIPADVGRRALEELIARELVVVHGGEAPGAGRQVTAAGEQTATKLVDERRASLVRLCEGWSPDQNPELGALITRLARELDQEPAAAGVGVGVGAPA
ncbi:MAG TPA: MDR family MFS transporter [Solirubrobacteraceae bacterium]|jgi:EmrB/QacA subfamily drug resistance transporter